MVASMVESVVDKTSPEAGKPVATEGVIGPSLFAGVAARIAGAG
jgi:hypothetical protein